MRTAPHDMYIAELAAAAGLLLMTALLADLLADLLPVGHPGRVVKLAPVQFAEPCYSRAIAPKTRGQDEKVGTGLIRLNVAGL